MPPSAPRDDLIRMHAGPAYDHVAYSLLAMARSDGGDSGAGDGNTLVGYPVVFDAPTEIDSWEGKFRESIAPTAVTKTLKDRGDRIQVLFNHGFDPSFGELPIGKPAVQKPDRTGLYVEVPLSRASDVQERIVPRLREGSLAGMSFRFSVEKEEWSKGDDGMDERRILELKLFEYGPVTFPAYEAATAGVRSLVQYRDWRETHREAVNTSTTAGDTSTKTEAEATEEEAEDTSVTARKTELERKRAAWEK